MTVGQGLCLLLAQVPVGNINGQRGRETGELQGSAAHRCHQGVLQREGHPEQLRQTHGHCHSRSVSSHVCLFGPVVGCHGNRCLQGLLSAHAAGSVGELAAADKRWLSGLESTKWLEHVR